MKSPEIFSLMPSVFVPSFMQIIIVLFISVLCVVLDWTENNLALVADFFDFLANPLNLFVGAEWPLLSRNFFHKSEIRADNFLNRYLSGRGLMNCL